MASQKHVYITLEWQEQGPMEMTGQRLWREDRKVFTHANYPQTLPCHNPNCEEGGFEIGDRIAALLDSGKMSEQNSLICRNAIHTDRNRRCQHTILYSITCILPYQREPSQPLASSRASQE